MPILNQLPNALQLAHCSVHKTSAFFLNFRFALLRSATLHFTVQIRIKCFRFYSFASIESKNCVDKNKRNSIGKKFAHLSREAHQRVVVTRLYSSISNEMMRCVRPESRSHCDRFISNIHPPLYPPLHSKQSGTFVEFETL